MARKVVQNTLNASTIDIMNVIRKNASYQYQKLVPEVESEVDIPRVGEKIYGTPALANEFVDALVNRIALVRLESATFYNPYADLKKGYLEFGETIEEVFVSIAKVRTFNVEKVNEREYARTISDVRAAFHVINWRVQYPVTIEDEDLRQAFLSIDGVNDMIEKIIGSVYTAAEYDEFLLFKYMMIKAISHGKMHPVVVDSTEDFNENAVAFRGASNRIQFLKRDYNEAGVLTNTPREDQYIFMDADFNARFDVKTLAAAFNMDKAEFIGKLKLIDDWSTFDNERFAEIRAESDMIEEVTAEELAVMQNVVAVLIDQEWFQVYDNKNRMTQKEAASGMYWNYFYNIWKTVSSSPYSNAIVFVDESITPEAPASIKIKVESRDVDPQSGTVTLILMADPSTPITNGTPKLIQTETATQLGVGCQDYGAVLIPPTAIEGQFILSFELNGEIYDSQSQRWDNVSSTAGAKTFTKRA